MIIQVINKYKRMSYSNDGPIRIDIGEDTSVVYASSNSIATILEDDNFIAKRGIEAIFFKIGKRPIFIRGLKAYRWEIDGVVESCLNQIIEESKIDNVKYNFLNFKDPKLINIIIEDSSPIDIDILSEFINTTFDKMRVGLNVELVDAGTISFDSNTDFKLHWFENDSDKNPLSLGSYNKNTRIICVPIPVDNISVVLLHEILHCQDFDHLDFCRNLMHTNILEYYTLLEAFQIFHYNFPKDSIPEVTIPDFLYSSNIKFPRRND